MDLNILHNQHKATPRADLFDSIVLKMNAERALFLSKKKVAMIACSVLLLICVEILFIGKQAQNSSQVGSLIVETTETIPYE